MKLAVTTRMLEGPSTLEMHAHRSPLAASPLHSMLSPEGINCQIYDMERADVKVAEGSKTCLRHRLSTSRMPLCSH